MSSILAMGIFIILDIYALTSRYKIRWKYTLHKLLVILLAMAALFAVARGWRFDWLEAMLRRMLSLYSLLSTEVLQCWYTLASRISFPYRRPFCILTCPAY